MKTEEHDSWMRIVDRVSDKNPLAGLAVLAHVRKLREADPQYQRLMESLQTKKTSNDYENTGTD